MTGAPAYMRNGCADIAVPGGRDRYDRGLHHPVVGDLRLTYEVMDLSADPGLSLVYSAEPGSASQDGLDLLASWAATLDQLDPAATAPAPDQA
jgi:MmyB-like transcription regulator ligand binding domain